jgi:hypothetical protein
MSAFHTLKSITRRQALSPHCSSQGQHQASVATPSQATLQNRLFCTQPFCTKRRLFNTGLRALSSPVSPGPSTPKRTKVKIITHMKKIHKTNVP